MIIAENINQDKLDAFRPEIYSKRSILWFSFLFTPVFGGILLMKNLKKVDKPREATKVLIISSLMTIFLLFVLTYFDIQSRAIQIIYNLLCALILTDVFYKKYFPDADAYPKKSVLLPLIISIIIVALLFFLAYWAQDLENFQG